MARSREEVL